MKSDTPDSLTVLTEFLPKIIFGLCEFIGFYAAVVVAGVFTDNAFLLFILKILLPVAFFGRALSIFGVGKKVTRESYFRAAIAFVGSGMLALGGMWLANEAGQAALAQMDDHMKSRMLERNQIRETYRELGIRMGCADPDGPPTTDCEKLDAAAESALANVK